MMPPKKILMACANSWTSCFQVGSHHLAREFVKLGYEVGFVSSPISPMHLLSRQGNGLKERFSIYRSGGRRDVDGRVWAYVPGTFLPPNRLPVLNSEWVHRNWSRMTFPCVHKKVLENGFGEVEFLYFDTPIQSFWLQKIRARKTVFRIADHHAGFANATAASIQLERELIQSVDLTVCTAQTLVELVKGQYPSLKCIQHLPNGVPFSHFTKEIGPKPSEYRSIPGPIVVYVGAIEHWFDYDLVKTLAKELQGISFVLIGPAKEGATRFQSCKNIHLLGPKPYSTIPDYLTHADVGMIPFDVVRFPDLIHFVNPLKLLEYMACGLPVVSVNWRELERLNTPALLAKSREEFKIKILEALERPKPKEYYQNYAKAHDWSARGKQLLHYLEIE